MGRHHQGVSLGLRLQGRSGEQGECPRLSRFWAPSLGSENAPLTSYGLSVIEKEFLSSQDPAV